MNSFAKKCLMVAAVATLGIIGSVMNPRGSGPVVGSAQASNVQDVNIVGPLPLTVQGTVLATQNGQFNVGAAQTGQWNVGINGTPNVAISGTPTFKLNNTAILPLPVYNVDAIGRIPYQKVASMSGQCFNLTNCDFSFGAVPAGHRLVVQHITGIGQFNAEPTKVSVVALNTQGQPIMDFFAPINGVASAFDQSVLFYVDAGFNVFVTMAAGPQTFAGGNLSQNIALTGYLLDCTIANCAPIVQ
jgi:hypothetical protein